MWVGARGAMSRMAMTRSSSWTRSGGISPAMIRQKRQAALGAALSVIGSPQHGLGAHEEPDRPDESRHQVRDVALSPRPREPGRIVGRRSDADQPAEVRSLDEERDGEVDEVDRQRDEQPRLLEHRRAESRDKP